MPNARVLPGDDRLALAHARMREATVAQLRDVLDAHQRGEDCGVYTVALRPFAALGLSREAA